MPRLRHPGSQEGVRVTTPTREANWPEKQCPGWKLVSLVEGDWTDEDALDLAEWLRSRSGVKEYIGGSAERVDLNAE